MDIHRDIAGECEPTSPNAASMSRRSVLDTKDANALTASMLSASEAKRAASPSPSMKSTKTGSDRSSVYSSRRRSAPISVHTSISDEGVLVKRKSGHPIDAMTAALLAGVAGAKVPASSLGTNRRSLQVLQPREPAVSQAPATPESVSTSASSRRRRPNLSIDIARKDSNVMRLEEQQPPVPSTVIAVQEVQVQSTASVKSDDPALGKGHLRRRSWKSVSGAIMPNDASGEDLTVGLGLSDQFVTRRKVTPKLTPPKESPEREEQEDDELVTPAAPRSSLEEREYELSRVEEENVEVLSDTTSPKLLSPTSPFVLPDSPYVDNLSYSAEQPSIVLRTKPSSIMLDTHEVPSSGLRSASEEPVTIAAEEVGTVARATRIPRAVSRRSSFSSEIMLRPSSRASTVSSLVQAFSPPPSAGASVGDRSAVSSARDRSSTLGSITSEGFRNMIASNRNSWALSLSDLGNSSAAVNESGTLSPTDVEATAPLSIRSVNRLDTNRIFSGTDEKEKKERPKSTASLKMAAETPIAPTITYTPPGRGSKTSVTNDENAAVPPSPTPRRQAAQQPTHQRSVPSLRYKPSGLLSMR